MKMKKDMFRKAMVFAISIFFIGACVIPSINGNISKPNDVSSEIEDAEKMGRATLIDALYKKVSRPKLVKPCFIIKHPIDLKPLARMNDENPKMADTFQLLVNGWEIVNAYSELVDPVDQRERFEEQAKMQAAGDEEAMEAEEDYLVCMEHGMPPISGWGMGIDRFLALLTNQDNLKD